MLSCDFFGRLVPNGDCLEWPGGRTAAGYGQLRVNGRTVYSHRTAMALTLGRSLTREELVLHSCDNPPCANPAHLRVGTSRDNIADMFARGRERIWNRGLTECKRGHPFDEENTYIESTRGRLKRNCRACHNDRQRNRNQRAA